MAWYWPVMGGALIGLAAGGYLLLLGRVAGISGLIAAATGVARNAARDLAAWFLIGLLCGSAIAMRLRGMPDLQVPGSWPLLVAGGLLVGYGTRLGSGCTSGHGVCGLARLSPRSMVATGVFMACGAATVWVVRHLLGGAA
ncbi:YeeE/YedE thiosulfate transporter family protein [Pseudoxanthomonas sp. JBR18]|uniref:YeeE/YedE family protein n=1 Tax=Pseudoxanthomonas sp. JBR18 TaxID=2969308 RepID=UPI00230556A2|nr:YeeE/YedE thiosulfate transporter family protein [Pseudoxanthomonas sp. JBR18]WCE06314.1 YeeE/YedE thiosulfate transporter family protein [Pseudoxanthomonas sp. JBR18]